MLAPWASEAFASPLATQAGTCGTHWVSRILCPLWESVVTDVRPTSSKFPFIHVSSTYIPHFITLSSDSLTTTCWQHSLPTLTAKDKMSWMLGLGYC